MSGDATSDTMTPCERCGDMIVKPRKLCDICRSIGSQGSVETMNPPPQIQTIEKTSKKLKAWLAGFGGLMLASVVLMIGSAAIEWETAGAAAGLLFGVGVIGFVAVKARIWWEHE